MDHSSQYTAARVHHPLAAKLDGAVTATIAHFDRYSVLDGSGIASQVDRHAKLYPNDADVLAYRTIPEEAFSSTSLGSSYGITFISLADIHHTMSETAPVVTQVVRGSTVFYRAELSSVSRLVTRFDGEDENSFTVLTLAVLNHLQGLRATRWFGDATRAARIDVDWARLLRRHEELGIAMSLGGVMYDVREQGARAILKILGAVSTEDDPSRRRKLVESRLTQLQAGGAALGPRQLPYGYFLQQNENGTFAKDAQRHLIPVADIGVAPALVDVHGLHAEGATYRQICARLSELESTGGIHRHSGQRYRRTFADALDSSQAATDAAVTLFQASRHTNLPRATPPTESVIAEYLGGGDPVELFTPMQRLVISRIELLRTGTFDRVLVSDIRRRGLVLSGLEATPRWEGDEYGYFAVNSPWPWPEDEVGQLVPRFGIDDGVLRHSAARLLRSLRRERARTGAAAHRGKAQRRVLQGFETWRWPERGIEGKFVARRNASDGGANIVLYERPLDRAVDNFPGWSREVNDPTNYARATVRLRTLCADLADRITEVVAAQLCTSDEVTVASFTRTRADDDPNAIRVQLLARAIDHDAKAEEADRRGAGARRLASLNAELGDMTIATEYTDDARLALQDATSHRGHATRLRSDAEALASRSTPRDSEEEASLTTTAYLVAGLRRASAHNGFGSDALGRLADESLDQWRAAVESDGQSTWVSYDVMLIVPLTAGGHVHIPISGSVSDIRKTAAGRPHSRKSPRRGDAARLAFAEGRSVDFIASRCELDRKRLLDGSLMPWLVEHDIKSRGAKCALVDHPHGFARRILFEHLMGGTSTDLTRYPAAFRGHVIKTYTDPTLQWGDAACPDDTMPVAQIVASAAQESALDHGLSVAEAARLTGKSRDHVRGWCVPRTPSSGFPRPKFLAYNPGKARILAIRCPHSDCGGVADAVVLLPEVASSGFGVLCSTCRRAPNTSGEWPDIVFPLDYLRLATSTGEVRLRRATRTTLTDSPPPFDVAVPVATTVRRSRPGKTPGRRTPTVGA